MNGRATLPLRKLACSTANARPNSMLQRVVRTSNCIASISTGSMIWTRCRRSPQRSTSSSAHLPRSVSTQRRSGSTCGRSRVVMIGKPTVRGEALEFRHDAVRPPPG